MKKIIAICSFVLVGVLLSLTACNQTNSNNTTSRDLDGSETAGANVKTGVKPQPDSEVAVIETSARGGT